MSGLGRALVDDLLADSAALAELRGMVGAAPAVYSCATLAAELSVTPRTIRAAIERGELAAVRSGRGWVMGAEAVRDWTARRTATPRARARRSRSSPLRDALDGLDG